MHFLTSIPRERIMLSECPVDLLLRQAHCVVLLIVDKGYGGVRTSFFPQCNFTKFHGANESN